jgi:hypothetical protein
MYKIIKVDTENMPSILDLIRGCLSGKPLLTTRNVYKAELDKAVFLIDKYKMVPKPIMRNKTILLSNIYAKFINDECIKIQKTYREGASGQAITVCDITGQSYTSLIYVTDIVHFTTSGIYILKNESSILSTPPHFEVWRYP